MQANDIFVSPETALDRMVLGRMVLGIGESGQVVSQNMVSEGDGKQIRKDQGCQDYDRVSQGGVNVEEREKIHPLPAAGSETGAEAGPFTGAPAGPAIGAATGAAATTAAHLTTPGQDPSCPFLMTA